MAQSRRVRFGYSVNKGVESGLKQNGEDHMDEKGCLLVDRIIIEK